MTDKIISIVVPCYNEAENLEELTRQIRLTFDDMPGYQPQVILVENGSHDDTWQVASRLAAADAHINVVKLSRNFGCDGGITAGLSHATGDAAVIMAGDLQDPPELIKEFVKKWEEGYENIYQIVSKRPTSSWLRRFNSRAFYYIINRLTGGMMPKNVSDYRLMDRKLYENINNMQERNRFLRGMVAWSGFKSVGVPHARPPRFAGESKARTLVVLKLALNGIFAYSYAPLQLISWVGLGLSALAFLFLANLIIQALFFGVPFDGYGTIMGTMLLMFGFLFTFLGIIGKYVGLIYEEVKSRPNFIVSETLGLSAPKPEDER